MSQHTFLNYEDIAQMRQNLRRAYETQREALGIVSSWKAYAENLERLARDNVRLVVEVDELNQRIQNLEYKLQHSKVVP